MDDLNKKSGKFFIIYVLFCVFIIGCSAVSNNIPVAKKGIIDLSNIIFDKNKVIPLSGEWEFYYGKTLTFENYKNNHPNYSFIHVPTIWNNENIKQNYKTFGIATYCLKIILPKYLFDKNQKVLPLFIKLRDVHSSYKLWINNDLIIEQGKLGKSQKSAIPAIKRNLIYFIPQKDTTLLIINVSNFFDAKSSGIDENIDIGTFEANSINSRGNEILYFFAFSLLLMASIYHLIIYLIRRKEKINLYLALISFLLALQSIFSGDKFIYNIFPTLSTSLYFKLWLLTLNFVPMLYSVYSTLYPKAVNKRVVQIIYIIFGVYSLLVISTPFSFHAFAFDFIIRFGFVVLIGLIFVLRKAIKQKQPYSVYNLVCLFIPILFGVNDVLFATDKIITGYYLPIGFIIFVLSQSIIISLRFVRSYEKMIELSEELHLVNNELEKRVDTRTKELKTVNENLHVLNNTKDRFISLLSHDLRNKFSSLLGFTDLLEKNEFDDPEQEQMFFTMINESAQSGYKLLEDLLEWSKIQMGVDKKDRFEKVYLLNITNELNEYFKIDLLRKNINLIIEILPALSLSIDREAIKAIMRNLLSNAIKYSRPDNKIIISAEKKNDLIEISIKDYGIGIPLEKQQYVFRFDKKYQRTGTSGENGGGVGLVLIKEIAEKYNGRLTFNSEEGKGSEFIITFISEEDF